MHGGMGAKYGTYSLGRLTFRTAEEARGAARDMGLGDVHSHQMDGETIFSPGSDCDALQTRLDQMGLPPSETCGDGGGDELMGDSGFMGTGAADGGMDFDADIPTLDEMDETDDWF